MPDYSQTPLIKKLGIKFGMRVCLMQEPSDYFELIGKLPEDVVLKNLEGSLDFIHYFTIHAGQLAGDLPNLKQHLDKKGMLWVSWPKQKSKVPTDLNGNLVRQMGLDTGLVDAKVCSVDDVWSALKFVWRKVDR